MVRDRLSTYLEIQNTFADTMYGFRPHRSAQDVLLKLHREILAPVEHPSDDKVVLALDLKGAFDNVTHEIILTHLSQTDCGCNTFRYIRQFLTDRQSYIRLQHSEHGPYQLGTRGTPQGAVLSPVLFNLAMVRLPTLLSAVPGVQHALYADDITLWATHGLVGDIETSLQQAASIVDEYARRCGLECSPSKSEFVHLRSNPKCTTKIALCLLSGPIPEHEEIRVLGLFIHRNRKIDTTLQKLRKLGDQVRPLPSNMTKDAHDGRRLARAASISERYGTRPGVFYTDAAGPHHGGWYTAAVIHQNEPVQGLTFRAPNITHAEEVAIALAAADPASRVIITDSREACRNLQQDAFRIVPLKFFTDVSTRVTRPGEPSSEPQHMRGSREMR
ncbi:uncharacterized protein LOC119452748 [Dermacentor silvarum]|uniref:uncharacterized protein LOC119452748 n=1 Tax=Dermacentor silvarum TaxID=543639 RepID=UPI001898344A|nr:uncharacterized protein LOC119452748 [Dermacentor silvarum]